MTIHAGKRAAVCLHNSFESRFYVNVRRADGKKQKTKIILYNSKNQNLNPAKTHENDLYIF